MSTEEPAWKAELYDAVEERFPFIRNAVTRSAIQAFAVEHIQAAEERGRREALREAALTLRKESRSRISGIGRIYYAHAADLIDPDKDNT